MHNMHGHGIFFLIKTFWTCDVTSLEGGSRFPLQVQQFYTMTTEILNKYQINIIWNDSCIKVLQKNLANISSIEFCILENKRIRILMSGGHHPTQLEVITSWVNKLWKSVSCKWVRSKNYLCSQLLNIIMS